MTWSALCFEGEGKSRDSEQAQPIDREPDPLFGSRCPLVDLAQS